jgi:hypothetical protein
MEDSRSIDLVFKDYVPPAADDGAAAVALDDGSTAVSEDSFNHLVGAGE